MIPSLRRLQMFHLPSVSVLDGKREARWECQPNAKKACYGNCPSMSVAVGRVSWGESWVTLWRYIILILDFVKGKRNRWRVYVVITTFFLWGANCRRQTRMMKTNSTSHQCLFWGPLFLLGWLLTLFGSLRCLQKTTPTSDHAPARKVLHRASRSLGSHLNGLVFFFLHPFGLHGLFLWEWSQVDPSLFLLFWCFGVWFSLSFSCLVISPLKKWSLGLVVGRYDGK